MRIYLLIIICPFQGFGNFDFSAANTTASSSSSPVKPSPLVECYSPFQQGAPGAAPQDPSTLVDPSMPMLVDRPYDPRHARADPAATPRTRCTSRPTSTGRTLPRTRIRRSTLISHHHRPSQLLHQHVGSGLSQQHGYDYVSSSSSSSSQSLTPFTSVSDYDFAGGSPTSPSASSALGVPERAGTHPARGQRGHLCACRRWSSSCWCRRWWCGSGLLLVRVGRVLRCSPRAEDDAPARDAKRSTWTR